MLPARSRLGFGAVLAAATFASLALAVTGIVRGSGHQIADTGRYQEFGEAMRDGLVPYRDFEFEYPPGAALVFLAPELAAIGDDAYFWTFASLMAVFGAGGVLVAAASLGCSRSALWGLALSPLVFGGVVLTRFDLVPALLVAAATLLVVREHPRAAAIALGAGAAVKWYPLALVPLVAVWAWRRRDGRTSVEACALALTVPLLAYLPFLIVAPGEVGDSVWRQISRPLQVESLGAGILVLAHRVAGLDITVETSYGSQNLTGGVAAAVAAVLSVLALLSVAGAYLAFARGEPTAERLVRYGAATLVALVAFGKVLSPQFLLWVLLPLALVAGRRGDAARACFAVAAVATAIWFPWRYFDLPNDLDPFVAALVVVRGLALTGVLAVLLWPRPVGAHGRSRHAAAGREAR